MSIKSDQKSPDDDRSSDREKEKNITNSRKNRSFIDNILQSNDEHAVKNLFEEYFYLHAKKTNQNRITWDELRFITNEILQRNNDQLILSEATNLFYYMYQLQYPTSMTSTSSKKEEKQLFLKKTKSEQELLSKSKERNSSRHNKKIRNE
jgi:hypothetical protein